jgi:hypothetical protein
MIRRVRPARLGGAGDAADVHALLAVQTVGEEHTAPEGVSTTPSARSHAWEDDTERLIFVDTRRFLRRGGAFSFLAHFVLHSLHHHLGF